MAAVSPYSSGQAQAAAQASTQQGSVRIGNAEDPVTRVAGQVAQLSIAVRDLPQGGQAQIQLRAAAASSALADPQSSQKEKEGRLAQLERSLQPENDALIAELRRRSPELFKTDDEAKLYFTVLHDLQVLQAFAEWGVEKLEALRAWHRASCFVYKDYFPRVLAMLNKQLAYYTKTIAEYEGKTTLSSMIREKAQARIQIFFELHNEKRDKKKAEAMAAHAAATTGIDAILSVSESLTLREAQAIVDSEEVSTDTESVRVTAAKELLFKSKFFETDEEAETHFAILLCLKLLVHYQGWHLAGIAKLCTQAPYNESCKKIICAADSSPLGMKDWLQEAVRSDQNSIKHLQEIPNIKSPSMKQQELLARHENNKNSFISGPARAAKATVMAYREKVLAALKGCGADLSRDDLLVYLIGPKDYLFERHGVTIKLDDKDPGHPFWFEGTKILQTCTLLWNRASDLESHIAYNFADSPDVDRITQEPSLKVHVPMTKRQDDAAKKFREGIIPLLDKGFDTEGGQERKERVKVLLLQHFGWGAHGILPQHIDILFTTSAAKEAYKVSQKIELKFIWWGRFMVINLWDGGKTIFVKGIAEPMNMPSYEELNAHRELYTSQSAYHDPRGWPRSLWCG